ICYTALVQNAGKTESDIALPKHVWDGEYDPDMPPLNIAGAVGAKQTGRVKICVSNSFAFGGANASLVLGLT
ncbi:MAG: 3-oxoacyl-ACP synthase, partial [Treponema socranskii subsp. buccale]